MGRGKESTAVNDVNLPHMVVAPHLPTVMYAIGHHSTTKSFSQHRPLSTPLLLLLLLCCLEDQKFKILFSVFGKSVYQIF
jgi:hypothetical protein